MKRYKIFTILCGILFSVIINAQQLPEKDTVLSQMILANKYFMDKWPDPGADIVTDKVRPSNLWTRATYYEGLMALYYTYADTNYYKYAVDWGESHSWKITYEGDFSRDADFQCCGQTYIELYQLDNQPERIGPIKYCIDQIVNSGDYDDWSWVDAMQMAMPVYAKLGVALHDTSYFNTMHKLYMYTRNQHGTNGLYNEEEHLWWRDKDFDPPFTTPNGKNQYWSRGNGWVIAALTRVLDVLPDTCDYKNEYLTTLQEMCDTLIKIQRYDGFWNPSLVDSLDYGGKETSGTAFFTFAIAWGINNGILDEGTYKPAVVKAWNGMTKDALHPDGFLGYVQGTGKQPSDGYPFEYDKAPNFEDYALGAFLLAGSEVIKMAPGTLSHSKPPVTPVFTIQENEQGFCGVDGSIDNNNAGFTGDGFANTNNLSGTGIDYSIQFTNTGAYSFTFRYASASDRPAKLIMDETDLINIDFPSTGGWTIWDSITTSATVLAGAHTLRLEATGADGLGNIDYISIIGDSAYGIDCPVIPQYNLTVNTSGDGNVSSVNGDYDEGTIISITATPANGWQFDNWSGDASGNSNPLNITMDSDKNITAVFAEIVETFTLIVATNGQGNVIPANGVYNKDESVNITATPETGWQFDNWSGDASGNSNPLNISMNSNKNIVANFSLISSIVSSNYENIHIYPNPVHDVIHIKMDNNSESCQYVLFNITGNEIEKDIIKNDQSNIDISQLNNGIYFIKIYNSNNSFTKKIIKQ